MDTFRKLMKGGVAGWRRTDGRSGRSGGPSDRKLTHRRSRLLLKRAARTEEQHSD